MNPSMFPASLRCAMKQAQGYSFPATRRAKKSIEDRFWRMNDSLD
jgi:hypothetical protein